MTLETIIENKKGLNLGERINEIRSYRELIWALAWRDFRVKYAQTLLGVLWAVIEPLATAVLLSIVFNRIARANTFGVDPILFGLTGMIAWNYFSNVVQQGSESLIMAQNMIKKIYFPRIIIPASKAVAALPDMLVALIFTMVFYLATWKGFGISLLMLPVFLFLSLISALSLGIWFSALNIRYRDFRHVMPFLTRMGLFITPIAYTTADIPEDLRWLFFLNPMAGIIEGIRWSMFGLPLDIPYFALSMAVMSLLLIVGFYYFNRLEKNIADVI